MFLKSRSNFFFFLFDFVIRIMSDFRRKLSIQITDISTIGYLAWSPGISRDLDSSWRLFRSLESVGEKGMVVSRAIRRCISIEVRCRKGREGCDLGWLLDLPEICYLRLICVTIYQGTWVCTVGETGEVVRFLVMIIVHLLAKDGVSFFEYACVVACIWLHDINVRLHNVAASMSGIMYAHD